MGQWWLSTDGPNEQWYQVRWQNKMGHVGRVWCVIALGKTLLTCLGITHNKALYVIGLGQYCDSSSRNFLQLWWRAGCFCSSCSPVWLNESATGSETPVWWFSFLWSQIAERKHCLREICVSVTAHWALPHDLSHVYQSLSHVCYSTDAPRWFRFKRSAKHRGALPLTLKRTIITVHSMNYSNYIYIYFVCQGLRVRALAFNVACSGQWNTLSILNYCTTLF